GGDELPDHGEADQQHDGDDVLLGLAADQGPGDAGAELRAEQHTADEAEEAEHPDEEALPAAGHGERGHNHDRDEREHLTAHGRRHPASTGTTRNPVRGMKTSGKMPTTSTPPGSRPTSSTASRSAAPTGPPSPASMAPPGKAGCPACSRRSSLRWMNSRSG